MESLLGATTAPTGSGAPPPVVALVLLALAVGVGWWLFRASTQRVGDDVVPLDEALPTDGGPGVVPSSLNAPHDAGPSGQVLPDAAPDVDLNRRAALSVPEQVAALDQALTAGSITPDEHRLLLTALLEGADDPVARPRPVPPPTE